MSPERLKKAEIQIKMSVQKKHEKKGRFPTGPGPEKKGTPNFGEIL